MGLPEPKAREGPMVLSEAKDTRCEQSEQRRRMPEASEHDFAKQKHGTIAMGLPEPKAREGPMVLSEARDTRCERSEAAYICEADA